MTIFFYFLFLENRVELTFKASPSDIRYTAGSAKYFS